MRRLLLSAEADAELIEAALYLERERPTLGANFLQAVREQFRHIRVRPLAAGRPPGAPTDVNVRRVFVRPFPYTIVYVPFGPEVRVIAIAHERRAPAYWSERLPK